MKLPRGLSDFGYGNAGGAGISRYAGSGGVPRRRRGDPAVAAQTALGARGIRRRRGRSRVMCREAGALFIVDDRADIAMLLEAGLHVGQDDLPPRDARRLMGSEAVIGFSSHNARAGLRRGRRAGGLSGVRSGICDRIQTKPGSGDGDRSFKGVPRAGGETAGGDRRHHPGDGARPCGRQARIRWR